MKKDKKYYVFELDSLGVAINVISIVLLIIFVIPLFVLKMTVKLNGLFLILLIFYFMLHEIFHSIGYVIHGARFKNIVYGIKLEKGVFYCLCKQNISKKCIMNASMYPLFFIGILTYIIGFIFDAPLLILLSAFNISGASGDIITVIYLSKLKKDIEFSEMDNPLYFAVYADYDVSKVKHTGMNFIGVKDNIERNDLKKITISKTSYIILLIFLVIIVLSFIK